MLYMRSQMQQMMLISEADGDRDKSISLTTDYLQAQLDGSFRYADIVPAAQAMMHHYLPTAVPEPKKKWQPVEFTMKADGHRLRDVQRLFQAPITLSDHPTFTAEGQMGNALQPLQDGYAAQGEKFRFPHRKGEGQLQDHVRPAAKRHFGPDIRRQQRGY